MQPGEIYLARFPFGDVPGMKLRPVLLLTGAVGAIPEVLVAYISSVLPAQPLASDVILDPAQPAFRTTNLKVRSTSSSLARRLGALHIDQRRMVTAKLRVLLDL